MSVRAIVSVALVGLGAGLLWLAGRSRPAGPDAPPSVHRDARPADAVRQREPSTWLLAGPPGEEPRIRVPNRPPLANPDAPAPGPEPASFIDLTNLIDAAKGDPVLFSYFGAIREQIQHAAGAQAWLSGAPGTGLVYVSFVLDADGLLRNASVVPERSVDSRALREAALQIVQHAGPFPPFPPSMDEADTVMVVPLEFLGS